MFQLPELPPHGLAPYPTWLQIPAPVSQLPQRPGGAAALRSLCWFTCDKMTGCREIMRDSSKVDWHEPDQRFRSED